MIRDMAEHSYFNTEEAAEILGYSRQHIAMLIRLGRLPGDKFGRDWLIPSVAVQEYITKRNNLTLFSNSKRGRPRRGLIQE